jgi:hypothetical protein
MDNTLLEYLGISMCDKRINKKKIVKTKIQKIMEELDQVEYSGLVFNQVLRFIRCKIASKMYCVFVNKTIQNSRLNLIDRRIRRIVNNFLKGQKLRNSMIYVSFKI